MDKKSVSIIVPAFNEAGNIENAIREIIAAVESQKIQDYEILIFDDCSVDETGKIADKMANENKGIKVIHNAKNMGLGYNYKKGIELAEKNYILPIHGDNEIVTDSIGDILALAGKADIIVPYTSNPEVRSRFRRFVSRAFTRLMNFLFGLSMRYYNGHCLVSRELLKTVYTNNFEFTHIAVAEVLIKLIKSGHSFLEVPIYLRAKKHATASVFRLRNIIGVNKTIIRLFWEIHFKDRGKYAQTK